MAKSSIFFIENRKSKVVNDLAETQKIKENAEKKLNEYNKVIENVKKEARKMIEDSKKKLENDIKSKKKSLMKKLKKNYRM